MLHSVSTRFTPIFVLGALLLGLSIPQARTQAAARPPLAGEWTVDPMHTEVNFTIQHLLISEVQGRFSKLEGRIVADPANLAKSHVEFTIQTDSVDTQVPARDADIKKKDYFDVADYPTITFVSTRIVKAKPGSAAPYLAYRDLTIKGVTQRIVLPFTINGPITDPWHMARIGVVSSITIDRTKFGVGGSDLGMLGKDVKIDISLEATAAQKPA